MPGPTAPTITADPGAATVTEPATATFSVAASGTALGYRWERKRPGEPSFTPIDVVTEPSAATATYVTPATSHAADDQTQVRATVTNPGGSATSNAATLTVAAAPITTPPLISGSVHDRTVVEGVVASFVVAATGPSLSYQWERALRLSPTSFTPLPGETAAAVGFTAALGDDGNLYRVTVSNPAGTVTSAAAKLTVLPLGNAGQAYVQLGGTATYDPVVVDVSDSNGSGKADLSAGTISASSDVGRYGATVYSGFTELWLYNDTGTTVTIAAGALVAHFEGTYGHTVRPSAGSAGQFSGAMQVDIHRFNEFIARGDHTAGRYYDAAGNVTSVVNDAHAVTEENGASVVFHASSDASLSMDLVMPELVLAAGQKMRVTVIAEATSSYAGSDFSSTPGTVSLTLPAGVTLDSNAVVPLSWIH